MKHVMISDGLESYIGTIPDEWDAPPNYHELIKSFAEQYNSGACPYASPLACIISGSFSGTFILHGNGRGGTLEHDQLGLADAASQWHRQESVEATE